MKYISTTLLRASTCVLIVIIVKTEHIQGRLPQYPGLSNIFEKFIRPYIRSLKIESVPSEPQNTDISTIISEKVNELKPYLQDNLKRSEDKHNDTDDNENVRDTAILEFSPYPETKPNFKKKPANPEPLKNNIKKYEKMRSKVDKALKKEKISNKTKTVVSKTLDDLITQLIGSQCTWKSGLETDNKLRSAKENKSGMIKSWQKKWEYIINKYAKGTKTKSDAENYKEMFMFLTSLREFFFDIHDELKTLNTMYKVKCRIVDADNTDKADDLRQGDADKKIDGEAGCNNVRICSQELTLYLTDFHNNIKYIVETEFKNYAEMYVRDINSAKTEEKNMFVALINRVKKAVDHRVSKTFKKETKKLKLGNGNTTRNDATSISDYVTRTVTRLKGDIMKRMEEELRNLDAKLASTIKEDFKTNLGVDLDNLEKEFQEKICIIFQLCNGNTTRRYQKQNTPQNEDVYDLRRAEESNSNSIYVKLNVNLDRNARRLFDANPISEPNTGYNRYQTKKVTTNFRKYSNLNVTRTSHSSVGTEKSFQFENHYDYENELPKMSARRL